MRIAQVVPYSHKKMIGGHEYYLSKALADLGHSVIIFTSKKSLEDGRTRVNSDLFENLEIKTFDSLMDFNEAPIVPFMLPALAKTDLEIIHAHEYFQPCSFYGALAAKLQRIPLMLTQHGYYHPENLTKRIGVRFSEISYGQFVLRSAKKIIAIARSTKDFLTRIIGIKEERIDVIPTGVDTVCFSPNTPIRKNIIPQRLMSREVILFAGRLVEYKGVDILIRAFKGVSEEFPDAELCILGQGSEEENLRRLASKLDVQNKITWINYVPHHLMNQLYAVSTVFVLPSRVEPLGIVLLEAIASGKPVVATKVGGIPDIISNGVNGVLVRPNSAKDFENGLRMVLENDQLAKRLGRQGRLLAESAFSWRVIAERIALLYKKSME